MTTWTIFVLYFGILCVSLHVTSAQESSCHDIDTSACHLMLAQNPGLCTEMDSLALKACPRFCNLCLLECYHCNATVTDYHDCNTTMVCEKGEVCMRKELNSLVDGHHEYLMTCALKEVCDGGDAGLSSLGGKRDIIPRDLSITCCLDDMCNYPAAPTTALPLAVVTTAMPHTAAPSIASPGACTRDIIFILDESSSMKSMESEIHDFVKGVVSNFHIGLHKTLVSVGTFAFTAHTRFDLNDHLNLTSLKHAINQVNFRGGSGDNNVALNFVWRQAATHTAGDRQNVPDVVILVTNEVTHNHVKEELLLNHLHHLSNNVITIGVGSHINTTELQHIATDYGHSFKVHNPANLARIESKVVSLICNTPATGPGIIVGK